MNIHGAHGYLIHSFLSPISNHRDDKYGGSLDSWMRFALEVAEAVRSEWPAERPIFYRLPCIDDLPGGWTLDDTVVLARELAARGVDVIDCSSRGLGKRGTLALNLKMRERSSSFCAQSPEGRLRVPTESAVRDSRLETGVEPRD